MLQEAKYSIDKLSVDDYASAIVEFTPTEIRECIQALVAKDQLLKAEKLAEAALIQHQNDQEVLAIVSLVAVTLQKWSRAIDLFKKLIAIQGKYTTAFTYRMLVRSVRCNQETEKAYKIVNLALQTYPDDLELNNELAILCEQSQKWEEAEKVLQKVIKLSGDNVQELLPVRLARATRRKALKEGPTRKNVESAK